MGRGSSKLSFEEYLRERWPSLVRTAVAICGDHHLGQELAQDVLVKLHRRWEQVAQTDNIDAYIRRALVNEYVSWRRKWARVVPSSELPEVPTADHAVAIADHDQLRREVAKLPRRQRIALALRYFEGLSDPDIASAMGCGQSSVRGYISRGLTTLRVEVRAAEASWSVN